MPAPESDHIDAQLRALRSGERLPWPQASRLLLLIRESRHWTRTAPSLTRWISKNCRTFGLNPPSVWRYMAAGTAYSRLAEEFADDLDADDPHIPDLSDLSEDVSHETLILVSQIGRVVPRPHLRTLFLRLLDGQLRKKDAWDVWRDRRGALQGRTARGRNVAAPTTDPDDPRAARILLRATILSVLRLRHRDWTGQPDRKRFSLFRDVDVTAVVPLDQCRPFDAVALLQPPGRAPQYHGIAISTDPAELDLPGQTPYVDYLWLAGTPETHPDQGRVPPHVGLLVLDRGTLAVRRAATRTLHAGAGDRRLSLATALLVRHAK